MLEIFKKKSFLYGIPFFLFVVGGSFVLREFQDLKFRYKPLVEQDFQEEAARMGIKMKKRGEVTLESEYEKMKNQNFDDWENKRIPRSWEEEESSNK